MKQFFKHIIVDMVIRSRFWVHRRKLDDLFAHPGVSVGHGVLIEEHFNAELSSGDCSLKLGDHVRIRKFCSILLFPKAEIRIGKNVFFNNYCSLNCLQLIDIGDDTMFGEGVKLYDHDHVISNWPGLTIEKDKFKTGVIRIGRNCWIGSNVTILKGVTIGDNCVIGANCLIFKSIPDNSVVKMRADHLLNERVRST